MFICQKYDITKGTKQYEKTPCHSNDWGQQKHDVPFSARTQTRRSGAAGVCWELKYLPGGFNHVWSLITYKHSAYCFQSEVGFFFFQEEVLFEHIFRTEAEENKMQRDRWESESRSGKIWISIKIGKRKE